MRNRTVFLVLILFVLGACYPISGTRMSLTEGFGGNLVAGLLGTVIGGVILSFIYFVLHDFAFKLPEIGGAWYFTISVQRSSYNPYKDMEVTYLALIWNEGNKIYGTAEKVYEKTPDGRQHEYVGDKRVHAKISGFISKNYVKDDKVTIHIEEHGRIRESSSIHELKVTSKHLMLGNFTSTAANSTGGVMWRKGEHAKYKMEPIESDSSLPS